VKIIVLIASFLLVGIMGLSPQDAFSSGHTDTLPTLTVSLKNTSPVFYQDAEGHIVVTGLIENKNKYSSVTNVRIHVSYFDENSLIPLGVSGGNTLMEVIPPEREAPFSIRSKTPISGITDVSVIILGFHAAQDKVKGLTIFSENISNDSIFRFSGNLQNGDASISDANVYLAFYDSFEPPRILNVSTIKIGDIEANTLSVLELEEKIDSRAAGILLFADSNVFYSDVVDVKIPPQTHKQKVTTTPFKLPSPFYQIKHQSTQLWDVTCQEDFFLAFKKDLSKSACVMPSTLHELIKRDWAFNHANGMSFGVEPFSTTVRSLTCNSQDDTIVQGGYWESDDYVYLEYSNRNYTIIDGYPAFDIEVTNPTEHSSGNARGSSHFLFADCILSNPQSYDDCKEGTHYRTTENWPVIECTTLDGKYFSYIETE
jgi:hypothetical protein